jgi:hypothetical protein
MQNHKKADAGQQDEKRNPEVAIRCNRFYSAADLQWNLPRKGVSDDFPANRKWL